MNFNFFFALLLLLSLLLLYYDSRSLSCALFLKCKFLLILLFLVKILYKNFISQGIGMKWPSNRVQELYL
jgi:hypothetical protein